MSTNVRPGDLAVITKSNFAENIGIVVSVVEAAHVRWCKIKKDLVADDGRGNEFIVYPGANWIVESMGRSIVGAGIDSDSIIPIGPVAVFHDSRLRPLRKTDEPDEMITIAGPAPEHGRIREWEGQA